MMEILRTSREFVDALLPVRAREAHKGDFGRILLLCGSVGLTGAAALAARAALRSGAGLIFLGVPDPVYPILAVKLDEPIVFPLPGDETGCFSHLALPEILRRLAPCDACLIGPGLGRGPDLPELVRAVIEAAACPIVLDADGLNALEGHIDILRGADCPLILTPHEGEFTRLGGELALGREAAAAKLAGESGAIVLLKGHTTVVTDGRTLYRVRAGNPGMATGGSGDVLAGVLASLLGQGLPPLEAAAAAAWIHGTAGDTVARDRGEYGLTPGDLIDALPRLLK